MCKHIEFILFSIYSDKKETTKFGNIFSNVLFLPILTNVEQVSYRTKNRKTIHAFLFLLSSTLKNDKLKKTQVPKKLNKIYDE